MHLGCLRYSELSFHKTYLLNLLLHSHWYQISPCLWFFLIPVHSFSSWLTGLSFKNSDLMLKHPCLKPSDTLTLLQFKKESYPLKPLSWHLYHFTACNILWWLIPKKVHPNYLCYRFFECCTISRIWQVFLWFSVCFWTGWSLISFLYLFILLINFFDPARLLRSLLSVQLFPILPPE